MNEKAICLKGFFFVKNNITSGHFVLTCAHNYIKQKSYLCEKQSTTDVYLKKCS